MKQLLTILPVTIILLLLSACHSDSFRIEARIDGLGTQNVQVVYATSEGVQTDWVTVTNDRLSYEGYAPELTVVCVLDENGQPMARMALKNGDKVEFRGFPHDMINMEYRGSKITQKWNDFLKEHYEEISSENQPMLDIAIEKFIRENPDDVVSTLLLLFDYGNISNSSATDKILSTISDDAKPLFLIQTYQTLRNACTKKGSDYFYMTDLFESTGKWGSLRNVDHGYNLIWLWSRDDNHRQSTVDSLKQLSKTYGKRLKISDICIDGDTVTWHYTLAHDSTNWTHYWAPGGPECKFMTVISTYTSPTYMLVDSFGTFKYQGGSIAELTKAIKRNGKTSKNKK